MTNAILRRIEKLEEAAGMGGEVSLEELVTWSYRLHGEGAASQAERDAFNQRLARSKLGRLFAKPAKGGPDEPGP